MINNTDAKETRLCEVNRSILEILLKDRSSKRNLIWATNNYASRGVGYQSFDHITVDSIFKSDEIVIKPRVEKSKQEQISRVKDKAEVFTPSWICNAQNNLIDNAWFGRVSAFNTEIEKNWIVNPEKVDFPQGKTWQDYVKENRLEITCGEAPFIVSRYDVVTGIAIPIGKRIGLLDRKFRIISENVDTKLEWIEWAKNAIKSIYGFDWQGDNVFLARENIINTVKDYYADKFYSSLTEEQLLEFAEIISWNIWQMDGLKYIVPNSDKSISESQVRCFNDKEKCGECCDCTNINRDIHSGICCIIKDWQNGTNIKFSSLISRKIKL